MPIKSTATVDWQEPRGDDDGGRAVSSTASTAGRDAEGELSLDVTFELLKNYRRRIALRHLATQPSTTLSDLAEHVAAQENDKPVRELSSSERKRVYISLYQCHLPKLHDASVVDFDSNRGTIKRQPRADYLTPYLDEMTGSGSDGNGPRWERYYLGLALLGGGALVAQSIVSTVVLTPTAIAAAVVLAVASLAVIQARPRTISPR